MRNIFKYIPMVTLGQIFGTVVAFPLLCFLINIFYYSNKYNDDAEQYYKEYMNNSYDIEVTMPEDNSKYYLENQDEDVETMETFTTKIDGNYFANPSGGTSSELCHWLHFVGSMRNADGQTGAVILLVKLGWARCPV